MRKGYTPFSKMLGVTLIFAFAISFLNAQPMNNHKGADEKTNFYELQKSFNDYWKDKDFTEKGKGWKPFKRWEWFWEQRVHPTGEFPSTMQNMIEFRKMKSKKAKLKALKQLALGQL